MLDECSQIQINTRIYKEDKEGVGVVGALLHGEFIPKSFLHSFLFIGEMKKVKGCQFVRFFLLIVFLMYKHNIPKNIVKRENSNITTQYLLTVQYDS